jgi:hypothetical protein
LAEDRFNENGWQIAERCLILRHDPVTLSLATAVSSSELKMSSRMSEWLFSHYDPKEREVTNAQEGGLDGDQSTS